MSSLQIIPGVKYGMLTVIGEAESLRLPCGQTNRTVICQCDCGTQKTVRLLHLSNNKTLSCGCLHGEKHGMSGTKLNGVWRSMIQRCTKDYAGEANKRIYRDRGIGVCIEWLNSFTVFYKWAIENGYSEGLELDRKDNDLGYSPENCRFVPRIINVNNRRKTVKAIINGESVAIMPLLRQMKIDNKYHFAIAKRIMRGWTIEEAVNTPFKSKGFM